MRVETSASWPLATVNRRGLLLGLLRGAAGGVLLTAMPPAARARLLQDESVVRTVIGILQPASVDDVLCLLTFLFDTTDTDALGLARPKEGEIAGVVDRLHRAGDLLTVQEAPVQRFSMTQWGNLRLSVGLSDTRDKTRLFLLHGPRARIIGLSREGRAGVVGGASPLQTLRSHIEGIGRPFGPAEGPRILPHAQEDSAGLWFRHCRTSPLVPSRDALPSLLSFENLEQLQRAGGTVDDSGRRKITVEGIALCLGVSGTLLKWLQVDRRNRHYRHFSVPKRDGGQRRIESPRIFLKVIQRFILHHLLSHQPVSDAVYSFIPSGKSGSSRNAIGNALRHIRPRYLAKIDITDFFGSLRFFHAQQVFEQGGLVDREAAISLSRLCTLPHEREPWSYLPQGAPTSPMISNLALREFDLYMTGLSSDLDFTYTRYADDISISGDNRRHVKLAALLARRRLAQEPFRLSVHPRKSRFVRSTEQQRVTGVIVNERGLPPRKLRRRVRAMFHQASLDPARLAVERARLGGYLAYFRSFPNYPSKELDRYAQILRQP